MLKETEIWIARDFSEYPIGRRPKDGPYNGQVFRDKYLKPLLKSNDVVYVVLDGVAGLPSSFLEEVFGGVIRKNILTIGEFERKIKIIASDPSLQIYIPVARKYAESAQKAKYGVH